MTAPDPPRHARPKDPGVVRRDVGRIVGVVLVVALAGAIGLAGWHARSPRQPVSVPTQAAVSNTPESARPASSTTTTGLPPGFSYIASATVPQVQVFADPAAPTAQLTLPNPWFVNNNPRAAVPLVFSVETQRADGWIQVLLPVRPNGSTGWIRAADVTLAKSGYHITVELGAHHLTVFDGTDVVLQDTVAIGAPATPTPAGRFYIRALLQAPNPHTTYGPYAYGLSGYSEVLQEFDGSDAELGIHGNNDTSVLGKNVSHGCVRMSNDAITRLTKLLPLGTPVDIEP